MGLSETLGIRIIPGDDPQEMRGELEVTEGCCQPYGYCSGGAMLSVEETLAGRGSAALLEPGLIPMGVQVSASHVKAVPLGGRIRAVARLLSRGRRLHVWNVDLFDEAGSLVSTARVTNAITHLPGERRAKAEEQNV
ncbi:PaaI family thioesterase [Mesosutterella sp. AGMB02718]|uniref:PaaI family thioesterase n=1 Tax=Mesosutterella faecium TaxID=2925194 RepID=A0ABT7ILU3_9BURK|nr:PaaI family thioesterase [Mesosutterella sp. AGMB02718]MDL2059319.1 PaaI family thioesterase [Mesosutterella sp. AGMB02718]